MVVGKKIYCVAVEDHNGDIVSTTFEEWNDIITLWGYNGDDICENFESEAHHLYDWCEKNDFILYQGEEEVEFFLATE